MEKETGISLDDFNKNLEEQLSVFKNDEKYDFVKDIKNAFEEGLQKSTA
jgi:hypothetical protein